MAIEKSSLLTTPCRELVDANLTGTLPTQLGLLSNLQKLYVPPCPRF